MSAPTGALWAGGICGSIAAISYLIHKSALKRCAVLSTLSCNRLEDIRPGIDGDVGLVCFRAAVAPQSSDTVLRVDDCPDDVMVSKCTTTAVYHAIDNGKLVEGRRWAGTTTQSVPWVLVNMGNSKPTSGITHAMLDSTMPSPPLHELPLRRIPVTDPGRTTIELQHDGFAIRDSRDTERTFALERVASVLTAGTLLTVVGRGALDANGVLRISAGVGPAEVTTETLSRLIDECRSSAAGSEVVAWIFAGGFAVAAGYALFSLFTARDNAAKSLDNSSD